MKRILMTTGLILAVILVVSGCEASTPESIESSVGEQIEESSTLPKDDSTTQSETVEFGDYSRKTPDIEIEIIDSAFSQETTSVPVGTKIIWYNSDPTPHTVTTVEPLFDSGRMLQGETFSYTFDNPGTFYYYCTIHPDMTGTVYVTGEGGGDH
ncbi:cupredoxin domain-containing protein [Chloroflexota bacterium]